MKKVIKSLAIVYLAGLISLDELTNNIIKHCSKFYTTPFIIRLGSKFGQPFRVAIYQKNENNDNDLICEIIIKQTLEQKILSGQNK